MQSRCASIALFGLKVLVGFIGFLIVLDYSNSLCSHTTYTIDNAYEQESPHLMFRGNLYNFTVFSYNLWGLPEPIGNHTRMRIPLIAKTMCNLIPRHDFYSMEELWMEHARFARIVSHECNFNQTTEREIRIYGRRKCMYKLLGSGLGTITPYRRVRNEFAFYEDTRNIDLFASKGFSMTRLWLNGSASYALDIYTTHMQAGHSEFEHDALRAQTYQLTEYMHRHSRDNAVILVGDFNMSPPRYNTSYTQLDQFNYRDQADFERRTSIYRTLLFQKLHDTIDALPISQRASMHNDMIERSLYRSSNTVHIRPIRAAQFTKEFKYVSPNAMQEQDLSDALPQSYTFELKLAADV